MKAAAVAILSVSGLLAGAGCGSSNSPSPMSASPPTSATVPLLSQTLLHAALLTPAEAGPNFEAIPASTSQSGKASGCSELARLINQPDAVGQRAADVELHAGMGTPNPVLVAEQVLTEPNRQFDVDYKQARDAVASCQHLILPSDATTPTLDFTLSPINFASGATSARLDAQVQGIRLNGYITIAKVRPNVVLTFLFFQGGQDSSQFAYSLFSQAQQKANSTLPK